MSVSALYIWIWGFSPILPCRFAQALSSWMGSLGEQQSSSLSADSQWDSSLDFGWAIQGLSGSCSEVIPVFALAVLLGVIDLLEHNSSPQSQVFCTLKQVLLKDLPVFGSIHCS